MCMPSIILVETYCNSLKNFVKICAYILFFSYWIFMFTSLCLFTIKSRNLVQVEVSVSVQLNF